MLFGDRLRKLREEKNITQKELGLIVGLSDRVIGYYESNDRFPKEENILKKFADYFNCSLDYLLGRTDNPDTIRLDGEKLPKELKEIGIEYLTIAKEMADKEIPPEDIRKIIDILSKNK